MVYELPATHYNAVERHPPQNEGRSLSVWVSLGYPGVNFL